MERGVSDILNMFRTIIRINASMGQLRANNGLISDNEKVIKLLRVKVRLSQNKPEKEGQTKGVKRVTKET